MSTFVIYQVHQLSFVCAWAVVPTVFCALQICQFKYSHNLIRWVRPYDLFISLPVALYTVVLFKVGNTVCRPNTMFCYNVYPKVNTFRDEIQGVHRFYSIAVSLFYRQVPMVIICGGFTKHPLFIWRYSLIYYWYHCVHSF